MKSRWLALAGATALLGGAAAVGVRAQAPQTYPAHAALVSWQDHDRDDHRGRRERHPELDRALRALQNARGFLQNSAHDFGGHRVKALAHTDEAIREIHEALNYDRR